MMLRHGGQWRAGAGAPCIGDALRVTSARPAYARSTSSGVIGGPGSHRTPRVHSPWEKLLLHALPAGAREVTDGLDATPSMCEESLSRLARCSTTSTPAVRRREPDSPPARPGRRAQHQRRASQHRPRASAATDTTTAAPTQAARRRPPRSPAGCVPPRLDVSGTPVFLRTEKRHSPSQRPAKGVTSAVNDDLDVPGAVARPDVRGRR